MSHGVAGTLEALLEPVESLTPYPGNARVHDLGVIIDSLQKNGQYRPIVGNRPGRQILAGNGTLEAAVQLGWSHVAVTWVDVDDDQARRIVLVDNRANDLASYDDQALAELLKALPDLAGTGFSADDLEELLERIGPTTPEQLTDPDEAPEPPAEPYCQDGDIWDLGPHRLVIGDGTSDDVATIATGGQLADLYLTDPPYNVDYAGSDGTKIANDDMTAAAYEKFLRGLFAAAGRRVKNGGPAYVFHADVEEPAVRAAFSQAGWSRRQGLIWVKDALVLSRSDHHWQHEPILYGWRPGAAHSWYGGRGLTTVIDNGPKFASKPKAELVQLLQAIYDETTVLRADRPRRNDVHPTMKPVALLSTLIERSTRVHELVIDTCAGSGSTLIACHATRRRAALVELDPKYGDVICRRWQEHTGEKPVHFNGAGELHDFTTEEIRV